MTKYSTKFSLMLVSAILVGLLGLLAFGIWSMRDKNKSASELALLAENAASDEAVLQHVRLVENSHSDLIAAFEGIILNDGDLVPLIESIQGTGRGFGLETEILSVSETQGDGDAEPDLVRIAIESRGSWAANLSFLRAIESLPYRVMVEEAGIRKDAESVWVSDTVIFLHVFK